MTMWKQVLLAMFLGILVGEYIPDFALDCEFLGISFFSLIKMLICPLVLFAIIYGVTSINTEHGLRKLSLKAIAAFLLTASFAACIGICVTEIMQPGKKPSAGNALQAIESYRANAKQSSQSVYTTFAKELSVKTFLEMTIPTNVFESMAKVQILQIVVFAFFAGAVMQGNRQKYHNLITICHEAAYLFFRMIDIVMRLAPYGVFGYVAATVAKDGLSSFTMLLHLIITIFVACIIQYIIFGILIMVVARVSPMPFYRKMLGPQILAFSTSSSKATLSSLMETAEKSLGISKSSSRFLLPLSTTLNMDGGAIYQASCAVFFSQLTGIELNIGSYIILIFMSTIASIGAAGIPSGVLLFLGMVLTSLGLPMEGVALIVSIDRILDMVTTSLNVTGDACITLVLDASDGAFNKKVYYDKSANIEDIDQYMDDSDDE